MSEKKVWTEDELHDLLGEAVAIVRRQMRSSSAYDQLDAAIKLLQIPLSLALAKAQSEKERFPPELG